MKNSFFNIAMAQASRLLGKPGRLVRLVAQMLHRLYQSDRSELTMQTVRERFQTVGRMVTAYARGQYRAVPFKTMVALVAAVLYFINPVDLIPDALFGIGLTDDLAVLTWVYRSAESELNNFLLWESAVSRA